MPFRPRNLVPILASIACCACSPAIDPTAESGVSRGFSFASIAGDDVPGLQHEHSSVDYAIGAGPPQSVDRTFISRFRVGPGGRFDEAALFDQLGTGLRNRVEGSGARLVRLSRTGAGYHAEYAAARARGSIDVSASRSGNGEYVVKGKLQETNDVR